jgi:hypothetical protein
MIAGQLFFADAQRLTSETFAFLRVAALDSDLCQVVN